MAIKVKYKNPEQFLGKLLIYPGRWGGRPVLFYKIKWDFPKENYDADGQACDVFFLLGEQTVRHYLTPKMFFENLCLAKDIWNQSEK